MKHNKRNVPTISHYPVRRAAAGQGRVVRIRSTLPTSTQESKESVSIKDPRILQKDSNQTHDLSWEREILPLSYPVIFQMMLKERIGGRYLFQEVQI